MHPLRHLWPALLLCGAVPAAAVAAPQYKLTLLDNVHGAAVAINNAGVIAGNRWDDVLGHRAYTWSGGQFALLPLPMAAAADVSAQGYVAGIGYAEADWQSHGAVYRDGAVTTVPEAFPLPQENPPYRLSSAAGINASGAVVVNTIAGSRSGAYVSVDGVNTVLPMAQAAAINDAGHVVGVSITDPNGAEPEQAVLYVNGTLTMLGTLPADGFAYSGASDINAHGAVVGHSLFGSGLSKHTHSFLYRNGQMTVLGDMATANEATAINNAGVVVGNFQSPGNGQDRAYVYRDGVQYDLNTLVPGSGWTITRAEDINDGGMIVGQACNAANLCVGALLSPVPEPAGWAMLLAGLGVLWRRRHSVT